MNILIDLSILRHPYCGLGQIALNYGRWYARHAQGLEPGTAVTLLVPRSHIGAFGQDVRYIEAKDIYRLLPWLLPRFDLWHSIHQLSPFRPGRGTPRIVTIHDLNFLYEKHGAKQQRYLRRLQRECDSAKAVCFISQFARTTAEEHLRLGSTPRYTVYNGVESLVGGPQQPPAGIDTDKPFLLSIGVVKPKKNIHTLFPTMDLLTEYNLVVAGDDSDAYARQLRTQLPAHPNILMTGTVGEAERRWLYAHCTALLMPSLSEGFGLPVVEAMQWGKPVFASRCTSLPEIGGQHAFYFDDFNAQHMAATIRDGLSRYTSTMAAQAIDYAATFDYERHMQQYWRIYTTVAESRLAPAPHHDEEKK